MRNKKLLAGLLAAFWLSLVSQSLFAQASNLARLYFVEAKPGHEAQLETAIKEHAQWRKQAGDPWIWIVHQVVNGRNLGSFAIRSGDHSWADFDSYEEFGSKGTTEWNKNVRPHVGSISSVITSVDTTNINWPPNFEKVNLISVRTYHLKPGHELAFTQVVNKRHTAVIEHNRDEGYYAFEWNRNGSTGPAVSLILPFKNWADMQGQQHDESFRAFMERVLGAEEAQKLSEQFNSTYHSTESLVAQVRRDLSVLPDK